VTEAPTKEKLSAAREAETGTEPKTLQDVWEALKAFLLALGDDVQMKELDQYVAFRRLKNFACVKVRSKDLQIWTRLDPSSVPLEEGFTRDVSQIGHAGTGDQEIRIQTAADLERAQPLLLRSYHGA
jgi:predicted transport protein